MKMCRFFTNHWIKCQFTNILLSILVFLCLTNDLLITCLLSFCYFTQSNKCTLRNADPKKLVSHKEEASEAGG